MIVPDVNLLIYAYATATPQHRAAASWWEDCLSGSESVGLTWPVILAFIRIMTSPRAMVSPVPVREATKVVVRWVECSNVRLLHPTGQTAEIYFDFLHKLETGGNLTTDAYIAALAFEYNGAVHSNDVDFGRFEGLRWINPLKNGSSKTGV